MFFVDLALVDILVLLTHRQMLSDLILTTLLCRDVRELLELHTFKVQCCK